MYSPPARRRNTCYHHKGALETLEVLWTELLESHAGGAQVLGLRGFPWSHSTLQVTLRVRTVQINIISRGTRRKKITASFWFSWRREMLIHIHRLRQFLPLPYYLRQTTLTGEVAPQDPRGGGIPQGCGHFVNSPHWRWAYTFPCQKFALLVSPFTLPVSPFTERLPLWRWKSQWVHTFHCQIFFRSLCSPSFKWHEPRDEWWKTQDNPVLFCSSHRKMNQINTKSYWK